MTNYGWEEYRILQAKIDKIGEFRFLVRGWAVTIVGGLLATKAGAIALLAGIPLVASFQVVELNQNALQRVFGRRLLVLERGLRTQGDPLKSPRIAGMVAAERNSRKLLKHLFPEAWVFYLVMYVLLATPFLVRAFEHKMDPRSGKRASSNEASGSNVSPIPHGSQDADGSQSEASPGVTTPDSGNKVPQEEESTP